MLAHDGTLGQTVTTSMGPLCSLAILDISMGTEFNRPLLTAGKLRATLKTCPLLHYLEFRPFQLTSPAKELQGTHKQLTHDSV